jgi:hypothetical protein
VNVIPQHAHVKGRTIVGWQQAFLGWLTTSSSNPFFTGACGEVVSGVYFAPVPTSPGLHLDCDVPLGVPILVSPAGGWSEIPTWGADDAAVIADVKTSFDTFIVGASLTVDGRAVPTKGTTVLTKAYDVGPVEAGSFFDLECEALAPPCKVDFEPGDTVRMASGGQFFVLTPPSRGVHTIELAIELIFGVVDLTLRLHVG